MRDPELLGHEIRGGATAEEAAAIVAVIHEILASEAAAEHTPENVRLPAWVRSGIGRPLVGPPEGW